MPKMFGHHGASGSMSISNAPNGQDNNQIYLASNVEKWKIRPKKQPNRFFYIFLSIVLIVYKLQLPNKFKGKK